MGTSAILLTDLTYEYQIDRLLYIFIHRACIAGQQHVHRVLCFFTAQAAWKLRFPPKLSRDSGALCPCALVSHVPLFGRKAREHRVREEQSRFFASALASVSSGLNSLRQREMLSPGYWQRGLLCSGGLSALLETLVSLAQGGFVQCRGDGRGGLAGMLQAQGLDGVRRTQIGSGRKERNSELGEYFHAFSLLLTV